MSRWRGRLSTKITGILLLFTLVALLAVGMTLVISWQLEGGAAAINDAGSLRMRSYRLGYLLEQPRAKSLQSGELRAEIDRFGEVLSGLEQGDPARPLLPPRDDDSRFRLGEVLQQWQTEIRPLLMAFLDDSGADNQTAQEETYRAAVQPFVAQIDRLVFAMERNYVFNTNLLRTCQVGLILLAIIGTGILVRFFFIHVIRPVDLLHRGIQRMQAEDFSIRLPLESRDEFGVLAHGFNQMVAHLQSLYATLEERVASETDNLARRNEELGTLYRITAFIGEHDSQQALCNGFLQQITESMQADASAIRIQDPATGELTILSHTGLTDNFLTRESNLRCGECICGSVALNQISIQADTGRPPPELVGQICAREGFRSVSAFNILSHKQPIGVFNLFYRHEHQFSPQEMTLLQTLGKHLGIAIENIRLRALERQAAVSEERNLLAQELHDSIAQGLAFLNLQTQMLHDALRRAALEEVNEIAERIQAGVQESYDDVRELLVHFRTKLELADLDTAILTAVERFEMQSGIRTQFEHPGACLAIEGEVGIQVLHIVQEALANVRKHSHASLVTIQISHDHGRDQIRICDDGVGFDPAIESGEAHVGLKIIRERALRAGANCQIDSAPGQGTTITLTLNNH